FTGGGRAGGGGLSGFGSMFGDVAGGLGSLASGFGSGVGSALGGLGSLLTAFLPSDARLKRDIFKVGSLHDGTPVYSFTYLDDPTPRIGLIAQDVERRTPGAVAQIGGRKVVDYRKATARARAIGGLLDNLASLPRKKVTGKDRPRKG